MFKVIDTLALSLELSAVGYHSFIVSL